MHLEVGIIVKNTNKKEKIREKHLL